VHERGSSFRSSSEVEQTSAASVVEDEQLQEQVSFAGLLPLPVLLETVNVFFTYCHNQPYSFFHEVNFRQRLSNGEIPDHLLFAVLANAVRFSENPFFEDKHDAAVLYANKSWKSIVSSCFATNRVADIRTVQTITLLSIFDFTGLTSPSSIWCLPTADMSSAGNSRHGSAWVKIGLSVRIAQDLKFMMESAAHLPYADQEERRRVFWSVYLLDRLVSCGRGRPPAILDASCQLQLPCDEVTWRLGIWKETPTLEQLSCRTLLEAEQQGPFAHVIIMAYTLSRGAQYMLQQFNVRNRDPPWDANSDFASIQSDLLYLESLLEMYRPPRDLVARYSSTNGEIDQHIAGPAVFSRVLFHLCYCLLNHPFLLRRRLESCQMVAPSSFLSHAFDSGWEHAKRMTNLLQEARDAGAIAQTSFYGYCAVVAGTIAALHLHQGTDSKRVESAALLETNIRFVEDISRYWRNVSSMVRKVLHLLCLTELILWTGIRADSLFSRYLEVCCPCHRCAAY
jgi:hypothetical protein